MEDNYKFKTLKSLLRKSIHEYRLVSNNAEFLVQCSKFENKFEKLHNKQVKDFIVLNLLTVNSLKEVFHKTPIDMWPYFSKFKQVSKKIDSFEIIQFLYMPLPYQPIIEFDVIRPRTEDYSISQQLNKYKFNPKTKENFITYI